MKAKLAAEPEVCVVMTSLGPQACLSGWSEKVSPPWPEKLTDWPTRICAQLGLYSLLAPPNQTVRSAVGAVKSRKAVQPAYPEAGQGLAQIPFRHTEEAQSAPEPQLRSSAQAVQEPPQSVSDSVPFFTPSVQEGGWQAPPAQTDDWQSDAWLQPAPGAHPGQPPPQSRPVSFPFFAPSEQEGAWHWADWHTSEVQSEGSAHAWPGPQRGQAQPPSGASPPQSTSLSGPFFVPSEQERAWQMESWQTSEVQSLGTPHPSPAVQAGQPEPPPSAAPPQSTSVSKPFSTESEQAGVWQPPSQTLEPQSDGPRQLRPSAQGAHPPPQSVSVSVPFFIPSVHAGATHSCAEQAPVAQSAGTEQARPREHLGHPPPQSTSVSGPLRTASEHDGA